MVIKIVTYAPSYPEKATIEINRFCGLKIVPYSENDNTFCYLHLYIEQSITNPVVFAVAKSSLTMHKNEINDMIDAFISEIDTCDEESYTIVYNREFKVIDEIVNNIKYTDVEESFWGNSTDESNFYDKQVGTGLIDAETHEKLNAAVENGKVAMEELGKILSKFGTVK